MEVIMKKTAILLLSIICFCFTTSLVFSTQAPITQWDELKEKAKGQEVYFNAWGGAESINDYILEVAKQAQKEFGIKVVHVKVTDISNVISRILIEKTAGKADHGSVDLMWINGEIFPVLFR